MYVKIGLALLFVGLILWVLGVYYKAQYLEDGAYATTPAFKADKVWRMEAVGEDPRVYEFRSKLNPKRVCTAWSATNKAGIDCDFEP